MDATQSNTRKGPFPIVANVDLTGKAGFLGKLINSSGKRKGGLPTAAGDETPFIIVDAVKAGETSTFQPLTTEENVRLKLNGTCVIGDTLVREDETGADAGKVLKLPAAAGTYTRVGIAEEPGVDDQLVLVRPVRVGEKITVV